MPDFTAYYRVSTDRQRASGLELETSRVLNPLIEVITWLGASDTFREARRCDPPREVAEGDEAKGAEVNALRMRSAKSACQRHVRALLNLRRQDESNFWRIARSSFLA